MVASKGNGAQAHGAVLDKQKMRVRCNYCTKVVSGFFRLKKHLGGVRGDVLPCEKVPAAVKVQMRDELVEKKKENLSTEIGQLNCPNSLQGSTLCSESATLKHTNQIKSSQPAVPEKGKKVLDSTPVEDVKGNIPALFTTGNAQKMGKRESKENSLTHTRKCIGRFFYDTGIDLTISASPFFQRMLDAAITGGAEFTVPSCLELRGSVLQEELREVHEHVKEIKHSWGQTGCSIVLDGWTDAKGRCLIKFLVDCPQGTIFLRSVDASDSIGDAAALFSLFDGVIEEVGVKNVIQVVTYNTSSSMEAVGKRLVEKHRTIFWTVCTAHCIGLMLEEIGRMAHVEKTLNNAKTITKFIYNNTLFLELMRKDTDARDLVRPSKIRSATPFLTLENIVSERDNLRSIFNSSAWETSIWASRAEGIRVADLIREPSFFNGAKEVLKATVPLVRVLGLINGGNKPAMGYIYETMDQAKEKIKMNFKSKQSKYLPFWKIVDAIWNKHLYSPLHAAGYFLNPSLFYSSDFFADAEVSSGLLCCVVRMVEDRHVQDQIVKQLDDYRAANGAFGEKIAINQRTEAPPALWWSLHGGHCPELQRFAIWILSQACSGASRFELKRSLSEQLHTKGRNRIVQRNLIDLEFVHYNLRLRHSLLTVDSEKNSVVLEEIDPMDDWVVEDEGEALQNDGLTRDGMNTTENVVSKEPSDVLLKEEL